MSTDIHRQCQTAVIEVLKTFDYQNIIPVERVYAMDKFRPELTQFPCITVEMGTEQMRNSGTNCRDDVAYSMPVILHGRGKPLGEANGGVEAWFDPIIFRQLVRRYFNLKQPPLVMTFVPELWQSEYQPGAVIDVARPEYQHLQTVVTVTLVCRVARG